MRSNHICAWCGKVLPTIALTERLDLVSHGICEVCLVKMEAEAAALWAGGPTGQGQQHGTEVRA